MIIVESVGEVAPEVFLDGPIAPEFVPDSALWTPETRQAHLEYLPANGFNPEQHAQTIGMIVDVGLPVNNFQSLARKPNSFGNEDHLGSWSAGGDKRGEFSLYDLLDRLVPEQRLATIAHESMHANTPFSAENEHLYGGESNRLTAAKHAWDVTNQSLITGVHLDGYHKKLIGQYESEEIDFLTLAEETNAIMAQMALTNRAGLNSVQQRQHAVLDDINRVKALQGKNVYEKIGLVSNDEDRLLVGIDQTLAQLLNDVSSYDQLIDHVHNLKSKHYSQVSIDKVAQREAVNGHLIYDRIVVDGLRFFLEIHELEEEEARKNKTARLT